MKQEITISAPSVPGANGQTMNVKPGIIVKSGREKTKPAYPPVTMPQAHQAYMKARRFDFF